MRTWYLLSLLGAITSTLAFTNPIIWEDLADLDIRNVNGTFYYSASTMHFSPGAPILRSYDLFNWEYIGHSVPSLAPFGSKYLLENGQRAYVNGIWASFFNYHPQQGRWLWGGCVDFTNSWIFSATSVEGPWEQVAEIGKCYYDCGMLVDDDGTMYVSYANNNEIWVAQLAADAKSEVKSQMVFDPPTSIGYLEGTRMYKRNGKYYILTDHPSTDEWVLQASSPWGPYTSKNLVSSASAPTSEGGGNPHQGGLVEAQSGQWYYMAFVDSYPGGRVPVLAPVSWGSDGFPALQLTNNVWGSSYPDPATAHPLSPLTGVDSFTGSALGPQWEWNHVPDTSSFSLSSSGLTLKTATVTYDLYSARNTLTHRILGPTSTATILVRYGAMLDGDRAGLAMLRDQSGWVGVKRDNGTYSVAMVNNINMGSDWVTINTGDTPASAALTSSSDEVYLRATAEVSPNGPYAATFSYSTDGSTFHSLGPSLTLNTTWEFFMGYRFGIFNYGTLELGGEVEVGFFQLDAGTGGAVATGLPTTSVASATSTTKTATSSGGTSTAVAGHYAQCGGTGYAGPTVCAAGYTCTYSNQYYSQCL